MYLSILRLESTQGGENTKDSDINSQQMRTTKTYNFKSNRSAE